MAASRLRSAARSVVVAAPLRTTRNSARQAGGPAGRCRRRARWRARWRAISPWSPTSTVGWRRSPVAPMARVACGATRGGWTRGPRWSQARRRRFIGDRRSAVAAMRTDGSRSSSRGADGALWHAWHDPAAGPGRRGARLGGSVSGRIRPLRSSVTVGWRSSFARRTARMRHLWQVAGGGWSAWASLGGAVAGRPRLAVPTTAGSRLMCVDRRQLTAHLASPYRRLVGLGVARRPDRRRPDRGPQHRPSAGGLRPRPGGGPAAYLAGRTRRQLVGLGSADGKRSAPRRQSAEIPTGGSRCSRSMAPVPLWHAWQLTYRRLVGDVPCWRDPRPPYTTASHYLTWRAMRRRTTRRRTPSAARDGRAGWPRRTHPGLRHAGTGRRTATRHVGDVGDAADLRGPGGRRPRGSTCAASSPAGPRRRAPRPWRSE